MFTGCLTQSPTFTSLVPEVQLYDNFFVYVVLLVPFPTGKIAPGPVRDFSVGLVKSDYIKIKWREPHPVIEDGIDLESNTIEVSIEMKYFHQFIN